MPDDRDVCARPSCGWYRFQHKGEDQRCPYHYRRKGGKWQTFEEVKDG